jgi:hypothetical protein
MLKVSACEASGENASVYCVILKKTQSLGPRDLQEDEISLHQETNYCQTASDVQ